MPAGHIGVVYEFGGIKGQIGEGLQFVAPWRDVLLANIQVQRRVFDKLNAFSEESQDVFVRATLNVRVSPQTIQELYRTVGPNFFNVLIESRVIQNFKDETVKYKSVEIAPNRENIRKAVRERLEKELSPFSIEVVDLLLDNIDFNPEFKKAIEDKQIATQRALEEQQKIEGEKHKAQQAIERAKGEGDDAAEVRDARSEPRAPLVTSRGCSRLASQSMLPAGTTHSHRWPVTRAIMCSCISGVSAARDDDNKARSVSPLGLV